MGCGAGSGGRPLLRQKNCPQRSEFPQPLPLIPIPDPQSTILKKQLASLLHTSARWLAYIGGALLVTVMLMSVASIVPRALGFQPIQGDFELAAIGSGVCIACFLPWSHLRGGNIIVDFFTTALTKKSNQKLDAIGSWLLAICLAVIAWRTGVGTLSVRAGNEESMIMRLPIWWGYAGMLPGLALTAIAAAWTGWQSWLGNDVEHHTRKDA